MLTDQNCQILQQLDVDGGGKKIAKLKEIEKI